MAFLHGATATHSGPKSGIKSRSITPYLLLAPGLIWLVTFFIIPILSLASTSTMVRPEGAQVGTYVQELRFQNYVDAFLANQDQYIRSFVYAGIATILALAIAYPLAYMIAFKSGKVSQHTSCSRCCSVLYFFLAPHCGVDPDLG